MARTKLAHRSTKKRTPSCDVPLGYLPGEGPVWLVVGGRGSAGITVRRGRSLQSPELPSRLECGALVEQVALEGERLRYRRLSGEGPDFGWVSLSFKGLPLLERDETAGCGMGGLAAHPVPPIMKAAAATKGKPVPARPTHWKQSLPEESTHWSTLETSLFVLSGGWYHPDEMAKRRMPAASDRVSVVTPTSEERREFHDQMLACFEAQDWPDKEFIVIETYTSFCSNIISSAARHLGPRMTHVRYQGDLSIGLKRNMGLHLASGRYVVHFDDDDLYAPGYISKMVRTMQERDLAALTLSTWYNCELHAGSFGFVDPEAYRPLDVEGKLGALLGSGVDGHAQSKVVEKAREGRRRQVEPIVYGYGFSYAYLRECACAHPFPDISMSEDYEFMMVLRRELGDARVGLLEDREGICLHVLHHGNTSGTQLDRQVPPAEARKLAVCTLEDIVDPKLQLALVGLRRAQAWAVVEALKHCLEQPVVRQRLEDFLAGSLQGASFLRDIVYPRVCKEVGAPMNGVWPEVLLDALDTHCQEDKELGMAARKYQTLLKGRASDSSPLR